jgi:hypothetical protein
MYTDVAAIDELQQEGKLQMRLYVMLSDDTANFNGIWPKDLTKQTGFL